MISPFKIILLTGTIFSLFQIYCQEWPKQEQSAFTPDAQRFINKILDENPGASSDIDIIDSAISDGFREPVGYMLRLFVSDKVVLTNTVDSLRQNGVYRFWKSGYGTGSGMVDLGFRGIKVACDTLDSIDILSDSVIALERLDLSWCNLLKLPTEIGKLRLQLFNIGFNYQTLKSLPDELIHISDPPVYWDTLIIKYDVGAVNAMPGVSDTLKQWLTTHMAEP